ncbi:hypothetical protein PO909_011796 [Leuciscus waleckii]
MRWARLSPPSLLLQLYGARADMFISATGAHTAIIILIVIVIVLQLDLRVTVAQLNMANKSVLIAKERSLKGREEKMVVAVKHTAIGNPTVEPFPDGMEMIMFGMGCFWGAERRFWRIPGVFSTQVGYAGGFTPNPTYHEVCSGLTGHTEVVRVVFSPKDVSLEKLLKVFWESHDPTQGKQTHLFPHIYKHSLTQMSIERPLGVRCSGPKANGLMRLKHGCICLFTLPCACVSAGWSG